MVLLRGVNYDTKILMDLLFSPDMTSKEHPPLHLIFLTIFV